MSDDKISEYCRSGVPIAQYVWPWGETGFADSEGIVLLNQLAKNLHRSVVINPLTPGAPPPMERAERIEMQATVLALTAEADEAKARGMELYRHVEELQTQLQLELSKQAAIAASLERALVQIDELRAQNGELRQAAARENSELQQLRALVRPAPPPSVVEPVAPIEE